MADSDKNRNERNGSGLTTAFRGRRLPVPAQLAGYAYLIDRFDLPVPLHHTMAAVAAGNTRRKGDGWAIYPRAIAPGAGVIDHLVFALRYEGVHLLTLKKTFDAVDPAELGAALLAKPTSAYLRRLCHFYEGLTGQMLAVPNTTAGAYVEAANPGLQYTSPIASRQPRFRVLNNLPGDWAFCPVVFRTRKLDDVMARGLEGAARAIVESAPREVIARAAAFLLLSDSKASFAIEGERPPIDRLRRWGAAVAQAGLQPLSKTLLLRLQREVIGDDRFITLGLRSEGGFVGRHNLFGQPEPDHISAKAEDLDDLVQGLVDFDRGARVGAFHPVLTAACLAFGFVYVHPFEDGNGRLHRFLMHHVLAERGFTPPGVVFPISTVILDDIAGYRAVLETVSRPLLDWIQWSPTLTGNVKVAGDTADYYRYFDATAHCEALFGYIETAVDKTFPAEVLFIERRDAFHRRATAIVDMSERTLDLLFSFLRQGNGRLSRRALQKEFAALTAAEVETIEALYAELAS